LLAGGIFRTLHQIRARHPERVDDHLHGVSFRTSEGAQQPLLWLRQIQRLAQDLIFQRLLAEQPLQFAPWFCKARYPKAGTTSSPAPTADSAPSV
jgi:hypothetical protein